MMEVILLTVLSVLVAYRATLAALKNAPVGTMRARLRAFMGGGGPGPAGE